MFLAPILLRRFVLLSVAATVIVLIPCTPCLGAATLQGLGHLPGGTQSVASAVSADGSTVVGYGESTSGTQAFRWTSGGGMAGLGDLPGGTFFSQAYDISADGSTVVGSSNSGLGTPEAFRWTSGGGMVGLGLLPFGQFDISEGFGVSADGSTVVGASTSNFGNEAYRWISGEGMVGLSAFGSAALGVSDDGSTIAGIRRGGSLHQREAFRWTSDGGMVGLGDLSGGEFSSFAQDISADGSTVVGYSDTPSMRQQAFRWTSGEGMVGLGYLDEVYHSYAYGVSGNGSVIVGSNTSDSGSEAVLWIGDSGTQRLWDVLLANGLDPAADGWTNLAVAASVSPDGSTIVGSGTRNGNSEAFVAVVPEPGTLALMGLAGLVLARRRARR